MEKHLEFTLGVINRMGQNSFMIKGWTITLVAALFALAAKDANHMYAIIAYFPIVLFWFLDSYYLYQERLFRDVYNHIRIQTTTDFSLDTSTFDKGFASWFSAAFSNTIALFYLFIGITVLIVMLFLK